MTARVNQLLFQLDQNNTATQPALVVGSATATVAGLLAVISLFFPISPDVTNGILVSAAFLLPFITALITHPKVWSPASVQEVVDLAVKQALEQAGKGEKKFNPPIDPVTEFPRTTPTS
jgi:hypothetical protein